MSDHRPLRFPAYSSETDLHPNNLGMPSLFLRTFLNYVAELVLVEVELVLLEVAVVVEPDPLVLVPVQVVKVDEVDVQVQDLYLDLVKSEHSWL